MEFGHEFLARYSPFDADHKGNPHCRQRGEKHLMAQEDPNRLSEWILLVREQLVSWRLCLTDWFDAVREEPVLLWQTPAVRYGLYASAASVGVWFISVFVGMMIPAPPAEAGPEATTADYHVVCSETQCAKHFVIHRKFGFNKFPVSCPKCHRSTGSQARRCLSPACAGRWVAPENRDEKWLCPRCREPL